MSLRPIAPNPDIQRLQDEGFEVEIRGGYLIVHGIPYVNNQSTVLRGALVTDLTMNVEEILPPANHQVWFAGEYPCHSNGRPIEAIRHSSDQQALLGDLVVQHRFSNKPAGATNFNDYYSKMTSYADIIANEARAIDANANPRTFKVIAPRNDDSVFRYHDSASSRADIVGIAAKLAMRKVAIVGLGGTGSYMLDLVAKTPVVEIHLFDGDSFVQHNAFRAPGAASEEQLRQKLPKPEYFARMYAPMRHGLVPHNHYLDGDNVELLADCNFVFLCVDRGPVRKLVGDYLQARQIPFIDVGMELMTVPGEASLVGTCRATLSSPQKTVHFERHVPVTDAEGDGVYRRNIQVADMNALNAALAVIKWKQYCGFYQDLYKVHHTTFSINAHSLTRSEMDEEAME